MERRDIRESRTKYWHYQCTASDNFRTDCTFLGDSQAGKKALEKRLFMGRHDGGPESGRRDREVLPNNGNDERNAFGTMEGKSSQTNPDRE